MQSIDLSGNLLCGIDEHNEGELDVSGLDKFVSALLVHPDKQMIQKLIFFRNNIPKEGCVILSSPNFLHEISLRGCNIDNAGLISIINGLDNNKALQYLDLRSNSFGKEGLEALGNSLFKNKSIRRLDISHNYIGGTGIIAFCEKISNNVSLNVLSMIECGVGDEGCRGISNLLRYNSGITHLEYV